MQKKLFFIIILLPTILGAHQQNSAPHNFFEKILNQANTHFHTQEFDQALTCYKKALEIQPSSVESMLKIAQILEKKNEPQKAIIYYKKIVALAPKFTYGFLKLAKLHHILKHYHEALAYYKKVDMLKPNDTAIIFRIASIQNALGKCKKAAKNFLKIAKIEPKNISALYNTGYSLKVMGAIDMAIELYDQVLKIKPDYDLALYAKALALLYKGDFERGWPLYSLRLIKEKRNAPKLRNYIKNNQLKDKIIFLTPEGGFGDTIQFIRYAEKLHKKGAIVIVAERKPLIKLLANCPYIDKLISTGKRPNFFHDYASIMSLPAIFESKEEDIPKQVPYLFPDKKLEKKWRKHFENNNAFKIGLCWEADLKNDKSRLACAHRSIPLEKFEKLSHIPNIEFYSLQKSTGSDQIKILPDHFKVKTFGPDFDNSAGPFMDTAAIMNQLDLVITVDTSVAHLAGALGIPVWVTLPYNTDWRWIAGRKDSPWYPTMRLFKQKEALNWDHVVDNIYYELKQRVGS
ncbi:tetratricopeptide repeat protein [Candidatus Dependentiae bacterium]